MIDIAYSTDQCVDVGLAVMEFFATLAAFVINVDGGLIIVAIAVIFAVSFSELVVEARWVGALLPKNRSWRGLLIWVVLTLITSTRTSLAGVFYMTVGSPASFKARIDYTLTEQRLKVLLMISKGISRIHAAPPLITSASIKARGMPNSPWRRVCTTKSTAITMGAVLRVSASPRLRPMYHAPRRSPSMSRSSSRLITTGFGKTLAALAHNYFDCRYEGCSERKKIRR